MIKHLKATRVKAVGTCALREAANRDVFLSQARQKLGFRFEVLSGEEEARYITRAITAMDPHAKGRFGILDIGGGSTELSICRNQKALRCLSLPLGAARLKQLFFPSEEVPSKEQVEKVRSHIRSVFQSFGLAEQNLRCKKLLGSSGTVRALSRIMKIREGRRIIHRSELEKFTDDIRRLSIRELLNVPGMDPKRADILLPGAILLEEIMRVLGSKAVYFTEYGLRDGLLIEDLLHFKPRGSEPASPFLQKAKQMGLELHKIGKDIQNIKVLCKGLRPLHALTPEWESFLIIATIFRTSGTFFSPFQIMNHSKYLVAHLDPSLLSERQAHIVAEILFPSSKRKPTSFKTKASKQEARKLKGMISGASGLLRLLDILSPAFEKPILLRQARSENGSIRLFFKSSRDAELIRERMELYSKLPKKFLGKDILVRNGKA